jgi:hypothetical protein
VLFFIFAQNTNAKEHKEFIQQNFIDDNYIILGLIISNIETNEILEAYNTKNGYFISFEQFIEITSFKIDFDFNTHNAKGWYIKEGNIFNLDFQKKLITLKEKEIKLSKGSLILLNNELYINIKEIEKIFPIFLSVDISKLELKLSSTEKLPFMVKYELSKKKIKPKKYKLDKKQDILETPYITTDYGIISEPITQLSLKTNLVENNNDTSVRDFRENFSYNALISNDLLWLNSNSYIAGNSNQIEEIRLKAYRIDAAKNIGGKLNLSEFQIGDVVNEAGTGVGLSLTNKNILKPSLFNSVIVSGDSIPGWSVELYRNNQLLNLITVDDTGRYIFNDVKLFYGNNIFEIVEYGDYGEVKRSFKTYNLSQNMIKDDKIYFDLQIAQNNNTLFNHDKLNDGRDFDSYLNFGKKLTDYLTLYLESTSEDNLTDNNKKKYKQTVSFIAPFLSNQTKLQIANDNANKGVNYSFDLNYENKKTKTKYSIQPYFYEGEVETKGLNYDYSRNLKFPKIKKLNNTEFFTENNIYQDSSIGKTILYDLDFNFSKEFSKITFKDNLSIIKANNKKNIINGENILIHRDGNYNNSLTISYEILPTAYVSTINIKNNYDRKLPYDLELRLSLTSEFPAKKEERYITEMSFSKKIKKALRTGLSLKHSSDTGEYIASFNIDFDGSTLIFREKNENKIIIEDDYQADKGLVTLTSFIDANHNNTYDDGEEKLENIRFLFNNAKSTLSDKNGISVIGNLSETTIYEVISDSSESDYFDLITKKENFYVLPRAGNILSLNIPFIKVGTIDGNLYFNNTAVSKAKILLLSQDGKQISSFVTDIDGFFFFPDIPIGEYIISLSENTLKRLNLQNNITVPVTVTETELYVEYFDIEVKDFIQSDITTDLKKELSLNQLKASKYQVVFRPTKYHQNVADYFKLLQEQINFILNNKTATIKPTEQVNKEILSTLEVNNISSMRSAKLICHEINKRYKIKCSVQTKLSLNKKFNSKENIELFKDYLQDCVDKRFINSGYFYEKKIQNKAKNNFHYKLDFISENLPLNKSLSLCKKIGTRENICKAEPIIKLKESFNEDNFIEKFNNIRSLLVELPFNIDVKNYDMTQSEQYYHLTIGEFQSHLEAQLFCSNMMLDSSKCRAIEIFEAN